MSASPFFYLEKYNTDTGRWDKIDIYRKNHIGEFDAVNLWDWNGTHELFNILGLENAGAEYEFEYAHVGIPKNSSDEIAKIYSSHCFENFKPQAIWFTYADLMLFFKDHPRMIDYEAMEQNWNGEEEWEDVEKIFMDNPVKGLLDRVTMFMDIYDDFWTVDTIPSDIRIVAWLLW